MDMRTKDGSILLRPVNLLNELEFIDGKVYANVWFRDEIAVISPKTGMVLMWIDVASIFDGDKRVHPSQHNKDAVTNGIAFDEATRSLYVTGKPWPHMYKIAVL